MRFYTNVCQSGDNILVKEIDNGIKKKFRVAYQPTFYSPTKKKTKYRSLNGDYVEPLKLGGIKESQQFIKENQDVSGFKLYGCNMYPYAFIGDEYPGKSQLEHDLKYISILNIDIEVENEEIIPNPTPSGWVAAWKPERADERVNVITVKDFRSDNRHVFTFQDGKIYHKDNCFHSSDPTIKHYNYDSEREMLEGFLQVWKKLDPDVVTGWNVKGYDVPYLYNRISKVLQPAKAKQLSPWGIVHEEKFTAKRREYVGYKLFGIEILDYMLLYMKYIPDPRESHTLGYISQYELGDTKIDWRSKYDKMSEFYRKDFQLFAEYNIQDVALPDRLERKLKLIELAISVAYMARVNYGDVMAQTRTWDFVIYNWLKHENIVIPFKEVHTKDEKFGGAYVKDPVPNMYHYIVSFDVASLYPNIIRALNIGPETKIMDFKGRKSFSIDDALNGHKSFMDFYGRCVEENATAAINGIAYSKENQSFYSQMVETLFTNRKSYQATIRESKKELEHCSDPIKKLELSEIISKLDTKQYAVKILMNSLYGAFGSEYFRFFDIENAEAVTFTGKFIINFIQNGINVYLNKLFKTNSVDYVIYCDTDSVFVNLEKLVKHVFKGQKPDIKDMVVFMDKVCKTKLEPLIDSLFKELNEQYLNGMVAAKPILSMKREVIADRGIWSGKKYYILQMWNSEGDNYFECNACHNKFSGPSIDPPPCNKCESADTKRIAKMKIKGFEMVKATLPQITKEALRKSVDIIMTGTQNELAIYAENTRKRFNNSKIEEIAMTRQVNDLEKWTDDEDVYSKGSPQGVKAVLQYNKMIEDLRLQSKYPLIVSAEKIKFVQLKQPNPVHDQAIAFIDRLPPEFKMDKFVDYNKMFEATYLKPLEKILNPIGWTAERTYDVDKFFN